MASQQTDSSAGEGEWWSGHQVCAAAKQCVDPEAVFLAIGHEVMAGRIAARPIGASYPTPSGRPKIADPVPVIDRDLWCRIEELADIVDIWTSPTLSLPATGNERAIDIVGLRFDADGVRRIAETYGYQRPPEPRPKNRGGISCRVHGVVVAAMTLDLLSRGKEAVLGLTGVALKAEIQEHYKAVDGRGLSDQNAGRIANGILEVVQGHLLRGSEHSEHH